jgi:hypothetical protein
MDLTNWVMQADIIDQRRRERVSEAAAHRLARATRQTRRTRQRRVEHPLRRRRWPARLALALRAR